MADLAYGSAPEGAEPKRIELELGALLYFEHFFEPREADGLMKAIIDETDLGRHEIELFGRRVAEPRLVGWGADVPYRYSGRTLEPRPMGPTVRSLVERGARASGARFNHALVNLYQTGRDSMGLHADDEPELGAHPVVASFSFGASRTFIVAGSKSARALLRLELGHGSLLVMERGFQSVYRHGLPKRLRVGQPRLNVTLRHILSAEERVR